MDEDLDSVMNIADNVAAESEYEMSMNHPDLEAVRLNAVGEDVLLSVPAFANAENRALNEEIIKKNRILSKVTEEAADHEERIKLMQEHLKNIKMEVQSAQVILESRNKELRTEEQLSGLAERTLGRIKQELDAIIKKEDEIHERIASTKASIVESSEKLEAFRSSMNWKKDEMDKWVAAAKQTEENTLALEKYTRADEQKIKDLNRELEALTVKCAEQRRKLRLEETETAARQLEIDKVTNEFRQLHAERQDILGRWQDILGSVSKRDEEIASIGEKYAESKQRLKDRKEALRAQEERLARAERENGEMETRIAYLNRTLASTRENRKMWSDRVEELKEAVELLKSEILSASADLQSKRAGVDKQLEQLQVRKQEVEHAKIALEDVKRRRDETHSQVQSLEELLEEKEAWLKSEKQRANKLDLDVQKILRSRFQAEQSVKKLAAEEESLKAQIDGGKRTLLNLTAKLKEVQAKLAASSEHVYAIDFRLQQMENKISEAEGEVSEEEKALLEEKIRGLKVELEEAQKTEQVLNTECKKVKALLVRATRQEMDTNKKVEKVQADLDDQLLQVRSGEFALKHAVREKEDALLKHDLLRLEVKKLRDNLSNKTDEVFSLENKAVQLQTVIRGRKKEVEALRTIQKASLKLAEEERHRLALELTDRTSKINVLRAKYENIVSKAMGTYSAELGGHKTQAAMLLEQAQRRESLNRDHEQTNAELTSCEKEIKTLRHALEYLKERTEAFRVAFHDVHEGSDEVRIVRNLEAQIKTLQDQTFATRKEITAKTGTIEEQKRRIDNLNREIEELELQAQELMVLLDTERISTDKAEDILQRAIEQLEEARNLYRESARGKRTLAANIKLDDKTVSADELIFSAQSQREANAIAMLSLKQIATQYPEMKQDFDSWVRNERLKFPTRQIGTELTSFLVDQSKQAIDNNTAMQVKNDEQDGTSNIGGGQSIEDRSMYSQAGSVQANSNAPTARSSRVGVKNSLHRSLSLDSTSLTASQYSVENNYGSGNTKGVHDRMRPSSGSSIRERNMVQTNQTQGAKVPLRGKSTSGAPLPRKTGSTTKNLPPKKSAGNVGFGLALSGISMG